MLHNDLGPRMIALRLLLRDVCNNDAGVFPVYAPVSSESDIVREQYEQLDVCIARKHTGDIVVIGTDSNTSIGVKMRLKVQTVVIVVLLVLMGYLM